MLTTARRGISYPNPDRSDRPDVPAHIGLIAAAADASALYAQGTNAARLAAAHQNSGGKFWYETDTGLTYYDDGAAWHLVGSLEATVTANTQRYGTSGTKPVANTVNPGTVYWESDTGKAWRSDGANWVLLNPGATLDYAQVTAAGSSASPTTEAGALALITGNSVTYDATRVKIECVLPNLTMSGIGLLFLVWYRDATVLGQSRCNPGNTSNAGGSFFTYDTPSAGAHTYKVGVFMVSGSANPIQLLAGAGGSGTLIPAVLRVLKA